MMLPTHVLVGLLLAAPLALYAPEFASAALVGALAGSILPDLDLYAGHRKTLHYPTYYSLATLPVAVVALVSPTLATIAFGFLLLSAAVHCRMDVYGGGLELRPWEESSDQAVYDHARDRWLSPRRLVAYDGSPGDLALAGSVGVPLIVVLEGPATGVVVAALAVATVYVLLRRRLAALAPTVFGRVPDPYTTYVPERYQ